MAQWLSAPCNKRDVFLQLGAGDVSCWSFKKVAAETPRLSRACSLTFLGGLGVWGFRGLGV